MSHRAPLFPRAAKIANICTLFASMECPPTVVNELNAAIEVPRRHLGRTKTGLATCQNPTLAGVSGHSNDYRAAWFRTAAPVAVLYRGIEIDGVFRLQREIIAANLDGHGALDNKK